MKVANLSFVFKPELYSSKNIGTCTRCLAQMCYSYKLIKMPLSGC